MPLPENTAITATNMEYLCSMFAPATARALIETVETRGGDAADVMVTLTYVAEYIIRSCAKEGGEQTLVDHFHGAMTAIMKKGTN